MTFAFRIGAATDVGVAREINQDSYAVGDGIAVVADGMGGHRGGEVASSLAAREMIARFERPDLQMLADAVSHANTRILDAAAANPQLHGMGTTVVALAQIAVPDGELLGVINVGDSRMYRLTGNVLEQLTVDHSLVEALVREGRLTPEEAEVHPQRNIVTRALGVVEDVEVDTFHFIPKVGDRYLLCSDGLFNEVSAHEIATLLATYADPQECVDALIVAANAGGGRDNITTVLVDIVEPGEAALPSTVEALASELMPEGPPTAPDPADDAVVTVPGVPSGPPPVPPSPPTAEASEPAVAAADGAELLDDADDETTDTSGAGGRQRWSWRR